MTTPPTLYSATQTTLILKIHIAMRRDPSPTEEDACTEEIPINTSLITHSTSGSRIHHKESL